MVSGYTLPPPAQLEIHDSNASEKWKRFFLAWTNYALATELGNKLEAVQVATLLTVIGDEGREIYSTFTWDDVDADEIEPGLTKFAKYCQPRKNIPFERYRCNQRIQELGESFKQYRRQGYRRIWYVFWGDISNGWNISSPFGGFTARCTLQVESGNFIRALCYRCTSTSLLLTTAS